MNRKPVWRRLALFVIAAVVIAADRYTKNLARTYLPLHRSWNPIAWLDPIVTLTHIRNTGAAFGLFPNLGIVFVLVAVAVVVAIAVYYRQLATASWVLQLALGLQLGGAAGNMIDRIIYGYVIDFIDFRVWPVFNIADSSLVVGTILLAYYALFVDRPREGDKARVDTPGASAGDAAKPQ